MTFGADDREPVRCAPEPEDGICSAADSGLVAFATLLAVHRIAVDPTQLRHDLGHHDSVTSRDLLRLAKREHGVRARRIVASRDGLGSLPLPALANGPHGWFLIGRVNDGHVLIQRPGRPPEQFASTLIDALWSGELVLITTREGVWEDQQDGSTSVGSFRRSSNIVA